MTPTAKYMALKNAHDKALRKYNRTFFSSSADSLKDSRNEQATWDALIDYVETHNLNYTEFDPRKRT